jgi:hypothetical protein
MRIEDAESYDSVEEPIELPVATIQANIQPIQQKEISPEARRQAEQTILQTLEIDPTESLDNFDEKLRESTKSLLQYQELEKQLESVEQEELPYELFKKLKKESDPVQTNPNAPKDGVLIKSMRQGNLECAGRTLIISTFLQEHNINNIAVSAPGHAFLIIEQSPETLIYFDANNNLFFTFPKSALDGYQGTETSSECTLQEYTPRETDFTDGITTIFPHFVVMPAQEAVGRQYIGNVRAALNGNEEFETSGIETNKEATEATHQIESEIYGENEVLESFYERIEGLLESEAMQRAADKKVLKEILETHPNRDDFVAFFIMVLNGDLGDRIPYIKNATSEQKTTYAEKVWNALQQNSPENPISEL